MQSYGFYFFVAGKPILALVATCDHALNNAIAAGADERIKLWMLPPAVMMSAAGMAIMPKDEREAIPTAARLTSTFIFLTVADDLSSFPF